MNTKSTSLFNSHLSLAGYENARSLTIVQGDKTELEFELKDKNAAPIDLGATTGKAHIIDSEKDELHAIVEVSVEQSKAKLVIDTLLPVGTYELYIKINDFYFPSSTQSFVFNITEAYDVLELEESNLISVDLVVDALREEVMEAIEQELESQVTTFLEANPERFKGEKGDPLRFEDLTEEQLNTLKGEAGESLVWENLTQEQIEQITGRDGRSFDYESLTPEQKEEIKGAQGETGDSLTWDDLTDEQKESLKGERGLSAYQIAVENGFLGSEYEFIESLKGQDGQDGVDGQSFNYESLTPEQKAEIKGAQGDQGAPLTWADLTQDQIDALRGTDGNHGKSAYELAVENGYAGTLEQYLDSLHGEDGKSFTWDDLTLEQKRILTGKDGDTVNLSTITDETGEEIGYNILIHNSEGETVNTGQIYHGHDFDYDVLNPEVAQSLRNDIVSNTQDSEGNTILVFRDGTEVKINKGDKGDAGYYNVPKMYVLSSQEYQALTDIDENAIYVITDEL